MTQEVRINSWGGRIINSLFGILIGIVLIIGSFILIFWNEGNGLRTAQALAQTKKILITVENTPIDKNNNNRVVYLTGLATTNDILKDALFNVSLNAIQLNRQVEMYQWEESSKTTTEQQVGGSEKETTTYSYNEVWSTKLIDSSEFKEAAGHKNPSSMPIQSKIQYATHVTVGDFKLPTQMISEISGDTTVDLSKVNLSQLKTNYHKTASQNGDGIYLGENADTPAIGDMRINITSVLPATVSIIAQQAGSLLQPYKSDTGKSISLLEMGQVSPDEMIQNAESENRLITWLLRLASLILMIIGFALIMKPLSVLASVIPFLGNLIAAGTGLIAFILGLGLWAIAISIAWFAVRPLFAIGLTVIVLIICYLIYIRKKPSAS